MKKEKEWWKCYVWGILFCND